MNSKHGNIDKEMGTVLKDSYNKCFETQKERKDITSTLLKYSKKEIPSMSFEECQNLIRQKMGEISDISLANYESAHEYKEMRKAVYQEMKALSGTNKELSLENSALELMDEIHKKTVQATEMTHNKCINIKEEAESLPKSNKFDKQRTIQFLALRESVVNYKAASNDLQTSNRIF